MVSAIKMATKVKQKGESWINLMIGIRVQGGRERTPKAGIRARKIKMYEDRELQKGAYTV